MRIQLTLRNKMFLFFSVIMPSDFSSSTPESSRGASLGGSIFSRASPRPHRDGQLLGLSAALVMFREQGILRRFHVTP